MTTSTQVTPLAAEDYDAIEAAVMETSRGRWFLAEYARRNRNADTDAILTTLGRLERTIRRDRAVPDIDRIRFDLADMAEAIARTKQEVAQMKLDIEHGGRFADASHELDAIVGQTETATNEILLAAENIQEVAWTLREAGAAEDLCEKLDTHSTDIYTACSFQDLTGQRTRKVVTVLRYLESRINAMMSIWGLEEIEDLPTAAVVDGDPRDTRPDAHLLNGPQLHGRGIEQSVVDDLMWSEAALAEGEQPPEAGRPALDTPAEIEVDLFAPVETSDLFEAAAEAELFETAQTEAVAAVDPAAEPTADVFAAAEEPRRPRPVVFDADLDLSAADVFSSEETDRLAAAVRERREAVEEPADEPVAIVPVVHGNTVRMAALEAAVETAVDPAPALVVVQAEDPIAALSPAQRIVAFG